jgi:NAD(P)-dependent dehydrogenase (short-subunit alcohol dehydrogenase family)
VHNVLEGRVAIVTGASSGIGRATALRFAEEGARVVAVARRAERLRELHDQQPAIAPFACDVTDHEALARCVAETAQRHGRVDILVNNAGMSYYKRLQESTLEEWRHTMAVNLESMYVLARLVAPHMIRQRYGRIVNVSSIQSFATEAVVGAYAATKGGISAWSRSLAVDLAEYGILVNVVAPGFVRTEMSVIDGVDETESELFREWYAGRRKIPLARAGQPEEIASAILFLSGDQCTYLTGQTLVVDGGLTITF